VVDGKQKLVEITIQPEALKEDASLLEDLVLTAIGEAQRTSEAHMKEALGGLTGGLNLPF
jgi:DNA-binding protein YbaB